MIPPLATRATRAAWPAETVNAQEQINTSTMMTMPVQVDEQGVYIHPAHFRVN